MLVPRSWIQSEVPTEHVLMTPNITPNKEKISMIMNLTAKIIINYHYNSLFNYLLKKRMSLNCVG